MQLRLEERGDGFLEPAFEQMGVASERDEVPRADAGFQWQMKAMDGVEEQEGPDPFIQVLAAAAERFKIGAFAHQLGQRRLLAEGVERSIAHRGLRRGDEFNELSRHSQKGRNAITFTAFAPALRPDAPGLRRGPFR